MASVIVSLAKLRAPIALPIAAVVLWVAGPAPADANGRSVEVFRTIEGSYELIVALQPAEPVVGAVHFTITPVDAATSAPVTDARVEILARGPGGSPAYHAVAVNSPAEPEYYDFNLTLGQQGEWTLTVDVSSEALGQASVTLSFFVDARPLEPGVASTFVWLLVIGAFVSGILYLWRTSRRLTADRPNEAESSR